MTEGFLRWVGGKKGQVDRIIERLSLGGSEVYAEPFIGGGSVFFALAKKKLLPKQAVIGDMNPRLCGLYEALRDDVEGVVDALHEMPWGPEYVDAFVEVREAFNAARPQEGAIHAARMIWLSRNGFNGLWRENAQGHLNVAVGLAADGGPKDDQRPGYDHLRVCARALQRAEIRRGDFARTLDGLSGPGLRVYADPPYVPRNVTATDNFVGYSGTGFNADDQHRLAIRLRDLAGTGATVVASNHDLPVVRTLYAGFTVETFGVKRSINRDGAKRGAVPEALISATGPVEGDPPPPPTKLSTTRKKRTTLSTSTTPHTGDKDAMKSRHTPAIVRELSTNARAATGRPRKIGLSRHTVVVGKNGAGKSRVLQSMEIALTKKADDLLQRREVAQAADLLYLLPAGEDRLMVQATFEGGSLDGDSAHFTIDTKAKGGKTSHSVPLGVNPDWVLPVRRVAEALRKGSDGARQFFLPFVAGSMAGDEIRRRVPAEFADPALPHEGYLPDSVDALVKAIETAESRAREESTRGGAAQSLVTQLMADLEPDPTQADLQAASAAVEHARKVLEVSSSSAQKANAIRQAEMLRNVKHQLKSGEEMIDRVAPVPTPLPAQQQATVDLMRKSIDIAKMAQDYNLPTCPGCGREANAAVYSGWLATLNSYLNQFKVQVDAFDAASTRRKQAEEILNTLRRQVKELEYVIGNVDTSTPEDSIQPVPMDEARSALESAQGVYTTLLRHRQKWDTLREAKAVIGDAGKVAEWWKAYAAALEGVVGEILDAGVDRFRSRVQQYLPADRRFLFVLRDGKRSICKIGLERDGNAHLALSGAEEAMVWLAMTAAILDLLPGGPPTYALLTLPAEKAWDAETLSSVMKSLSEVPYQIILTTTVAPKRPPKAWQIIDLDKTEEEEYNGDLGLGEVAPEA